MSKQIYSQLETEKQDNSQVAISGEITWEHLESYYKSTLEKMAAEVEIDGFRKGKAPIDQVESKIGQLVILQEAAQTALGDAYPAIVMEQQLHIIGYPQIAITKIAHGSELGFTITTAVMPEVSLADYAAIAKSHNKESSEVSVSDEEFDQAIEQMSAMYKSMKSPCNHGEKQDCEEDNDCSSCGDDDSFELTDEFVQKLGDFKTVDDFKEQFRQDMLARKEQEELGKRRESLIMEIAEKSQFEVPTVLVEAEKDKMLAAMKDDVARMGLEYTQWLEHSGKTEDELRTEMDKDALARAQAEIVLKEIAQKENLQADEEKMAEQMTQIKEMYQDVSEENIRAYLENLYLNEAVLNYLESQK